MKATKDILTTKIDVLVDACAKNPGGATVVGILLTIAGIAGMVQLRHRRGFAEATSITAYGASMAAFVGTGNVETYRTILVWSAYSVTATLTLILVAACGYLLYAETSNRCRIKNRRTAKRA